MRNVPIFFFFPIISDKETNLCITTLFLIDQCEQTEKINTSDAAVDGIDDVSRGWSPPLPSEKKKKYPRLWRWEIEKKILLTAQRILSLIRLYLYCIYLYVKPWEMAIQWEKKKGKKNNIEWGKNRLSVSVWSRKTSIMAQIYIFYYGLTFDLWLAGQ